MAGGLMRMLRKLALLVVAFGLVLGVLLGLLLGWYVWPVKWYDTDPADLRAEHQRQYVIMAADSYAVTGDADLARERLIALTGEDTSWEQVADLVGQVATAAQQEGDAATALRVRRLAQAVALPESPEATYAPPTRAVLQPPRWVLMLIGFGVLLIALTMVVWVALGFLRRSRHVPAGDEGLQTLSDALHQAEPRGVAGVPADRIPWEETPPAPPRGRIQPVARLGVPKTRRTASPASIPTPVESAPPREPELPQSVPAPRPTRARPGLRRALGLYEAEYRFGDDDFDCSFSIESPDGEFLGECGVGVGDVLEDDDDNQQVDAFEVWLFDKEDIRTVSKVLVSDYAREDPELHARLSATGELLQPQPGLAFLLETRTLRVRATVTECEYLPDALTPNSVFARLAVTLEAEAVESS
ncbi:MAG: hypothetical protein FJZ90_01250 [Chloroflexi bacterium]|nr:hypothetical protein [Chloroflexota bacterium]